MLNLARLDSKMLKNICNGFLIDSINNKVNMVINWHNYLTLNSQIEWYAKHAKITNKLHKIQIYGNSLYPNQTKTIYKSSTNMSKQ